jgi:hypothetical protein
VQVALVEQRVRAAVEARRVEFEALVKEAGERELAALVDAELARRLKGSLGFELEEAAAAVVNGGARAASRVCSACQRELPATEVAHWRRQCRECRRRLQRERSARKQQAAAAGLARATDR